MQESESKIIPLPREESGEYYFSKDVLESIIKQINANTRALENLNVVDEGGEEPITHDSTPMEMALKISNLLRKSGVVGEIKIFILPQLVYKILSNYAGPPLLPSNWQELDGQPYRPGSWFKGNTADIRGTYFRMVDISGEKNPLGKYLFPGDYQKEEFPLSSKAPVFDDSNFKESDKKTQRARVKEVRPKTVIVWAVQKIKMYAEEVGENVRRD